MDGMISEPEMRDALERSGYLLEQRVYIVLQAYGYFPEPNKAYPDEISGKSRELDLDAITALDLGRYDFLFPYILCSCINNSQPLAFLTFESPIPFLHHEQLKMSGLPIRTRAAEGHPFESLSESLHLERYHHYRQAAIATQYCSFKRMKDKDSSQYRWIALHADEHHDAIQCLTLALRSTMAEHYEKWDLNPDNEQSINIQVYYPILIVQGALYEVRVDGAQFDVKATNHILFRREHHSTQGRDEHFVDVVTENGLPTLLDTIDFEMARMGRAIRRRKQLFRESMKAIVERAAETGKVREAFEEIA